MHLFISLFNLEFTYRPVIAFYVVEKSRSKKIKDQEGS